MPLPDGDKLTWPPLQARPALDAMREWAAWYSGDPARLTDVYGALIGSTSSSSGGITTQSRPWWKFWARAGQSGSAARQRAQLHVPLAGDIAATSAALLFSEPPTIQVPEAHGDKPQKKAQRAEARMQALLEEGGFDSRLVEGADVAAGLGGVYLKPAWDTDVLDVAVLDIVQPDQALPEFRLGQLVAVTLWRTVTKDDRTVLRHLERHERGADDRGVILHGLYRGTDSELGARQSDEELAALLGLPPIVELPFPGLGIRYVPNMRPNRRLRGSPLGQSDYAGAEGMLDSLDEAWGSWMRDIRLGKARLLVPDSFLDGSSKFDVDHEVFTQLEVPPASAASGISDQIMAQQFEIRVDAHAKTTLGLIERIVDHAGYAPQTFGLNVEATGELSGVAMNIRERKSFLTQQRKAAWWGAAIADLVEMLLAIDREVFKRRDTQVVRPRVEISDSLARDDRQIAETVQLWANARAASTEVKVRTLHPEWEREEVTREVARIQAEEGLVVTPPEQTAP